MPTSDELMRLARAAADQITLPRRKRQFPSFAEIEEQCPAQYEDLLGLLHDDDVFQAADLERQETLVQAIQVALPEAARHLIDELVDNQAAQVWLQQEGAFHLGVAVGMRMASEPVVGDHDDKDDDDDDTE